VEISDTDDCAVIGNALSHYIDILKERLIDIDPTLEEDDYAHNADMLERAQRLYAECDW
jgi:hypothetical protein